MNVIKTLRRKFILISTATVIIIVAGVLGLVNTIAHMRVYTQIETYLAYIAQNGESPLPKKILQDGSWFGETEWSDDTPAFIVIILFLHRMKHSQLLFESVFSIFLIFRKVIDFYGISHIIDRRLAVGGNACARPHIFGAFSANAIPRIECPMRVIF